MDFSAFINSLATYPWVSLGSFILTLIAVILAIFFYIKGKRKKSIRCCFRSLSLIEGFVGEINGLLIQFSGKQIGTLIVTKFAFWNNGTETITRDDFPSNKTFSIEVNNDYDILDVSILKSSDNSNNISVKVSDDGKKTDVDFEYLDNKDGFVLQLLHTCNKKDNKFILNGYIKGFGLLSKGEIYFNNNFGLIMLIYIISATIFSLLSNNIINKLFSNILLLSFILFMATIIILLPKLEKSKLPKKLKDFFFR
jgi:hypothetical protein